MQTKPAFSRYKEHWREPFCVDDNGECFDLVCFSGERIKGYVKTRPREYAVLSKKLFRHPSGIENFSEIASFRNAASAIKYGRLYSPNYYRPFKKIRGFKIYPILCGGDCESSNIDMSFYVEPSSLIRVVLDKLFRLFVFVRIKKK